MTKSIKLVRASDGTGNAATATIQSVRSSGATTIIVNTVDNIPDYFVGTMGTPHTFTDPVTSETVTVISEATAVDFRGHVDSTNLEIDSIVPGYTDNGSAVGDIVIIRPTTDWADNLADILDEVHEDDGSLKPDAPINSPQGSIDLITPIGSVIDFAGSSAPTGWLLCYGQTLNASSSPQYQDLYDVIGNTYGGTNNTNFVIPDLRGRVIAGKDNMGGTSANRLTNPGSTGGMDGDILGNTGGQEAHTQTTGELATHTHTQNSHSHTLSVTSSGGGGGGGTFVGGAGSVNTGGTTATNNNEGSSTPFNIVQPTIILNKIIKY